MVVLTEGTDYEIFSVNRGDGINEVIVKTINTVDDGDTLTVDLTKYGISATGLLAVLGFEHSTANSIAVQQQPTTVVATGVLTITVGGSSDNRQRYFLVKGFAQPNPSSSL